MIHPANAGATGFFLERTGRGFSSLEFERMKSGTRLFLGGTLLGLGLLIGYRLTMLPAESVSPVGDEMQWQVATTPDSASGTGRIDDVQILPFAAKPDSRKARIDMTGEPQSAKPLALIEHELRSSAANPLEQVFDKPVSGRSAIRSLPSVGSDNTGTAFTRNPYINGLAKSNREVPHTTIQNDSNGLTGKGPELAAATSTSPASRNGSPVWLSTNEDADVPEDNARTTSPLKSEVKFPAQGSNIALSRQLSPGTSSDKTSTAMNSEFKPAAGGFAGPDLALASSPDLPSLQDQPTATGFRRERDTNQAGYHAMHRPGNAKAKKKERELATQPAVSNSLPVVEQRAAEHLEYGKSLARRGSTFAAREEFIQSLRLVAEARDAEQKSRQYTSELAAGLQALTEANDFLRLDARQQLSIDLTSIISVHSTRIIDQADARRTTGRFTPCRPTTGLLWKRSRTRSASQMSRANLCTPWES